MGYGLWGHKGLGITKASEHKQDVVFLIIKYYTNSNYHEKIGP